MFQLQRHSFTATISRFIKLRNNTARTLKQIHAQITTFPYAHKSHHHFLISRLLFFAAITNPSFLVYATRIFQHLHNPTPPLYNIMIRAHASTPTNSRDLLSSQCFRFYMQMVSNNIAPHSLTLTFLIKECVRNSDLVNGRGIHGQVVKLGFYGCDLYVQNSVIGFYSAFGFVGSAKQVFDEMIERDIVSWNSMIVGYLRNGCLDDALCLFRGMERRNIVTWNSIITGFVQGGRAKKSLELFREMLCLSEGEEGVRPDGITIASVLSACAYLGAIDHGKWVHDYLRRRGLECDVVIGTALVDMYGKCGSLERASDVFRQMPEKDTSAWTAMISVLGSHGRGDEAFDIFVEMVAKGVKPNHITFVGLLSACAHSGLVAKGRWCFDVMKRDYSIEPGIYHYACVVDILARAGHFEEAMCLISSMPMEPDAYVLGALLGGCQMHGNVVLGERVAKWLIDIQPLNHAFYVNLCDIYAKAGRLDDVKRTRAIMKERGIKKEVAGCSMIEIDGIVYEFSVLRMPDIIKEEPINILTVLNNEMRIEGDNPPCLPSEVC